MARAYPVQPGVSAAGHVSANGFWHPGSVSNCQKAPCQEPHAHHWVPKREGTLNGEPVFVQACRCGFYYRNGRVTYR